MKIDVRAWEILSEDEQLSLNLQYAEGKSTWEAGEIMGKSHYKYLEIKYRAAQYLRMFTHHFQFFDTVIPYGVTGNKEIIEYFDLVMTKRKKVHEAMAELDIKYGNQAKRGRELDIIEQMGTWEISPNLYNTTLYHLIKDFDRWNNFRILPKEIQDPSAFNRRVKNIHRRHIKMVTTFPDISINRIIDTFGIQNKHIKKGITPTYLAIKTQNKNIHILKIRNTPQIVEKLTNLSLYLFENPKQAEDYLLLVHEYTAPDKRKCQDGLIFWPQYRKLIKHAHNYKEVQNIPSSRSYLIQALEKLTLL